MHVSEIGTVQILAASATKIGSAKFMTELQILKLMYKIKEKHNTITIGIFNVQQCLNLILGQLIKR